MKYCWIHCLPCKSLMVRLFCGPSPLYRWSSISHHPLAFQKLASGWNFWLRQQRWTEMLGNQSRASRFLLKASGYVLHYVHHMGRIVLFTHSFSLILLDFLLIYHNDSPFQRTYNSVRFSTRVKKGHLSAYWYHQHSPRAKRHFDACWLWVTQSMTVASCLPSIGRNNDLSNLFIHQATTNSEIDIVSPTPFMVRSPQDMIATVVFWIFSIAETSRLSSTTRMRDGSQAFHLDKSRRFLHQINSQIMQYPSSRLAFGEFFCGKFINIIWHATV